ncbi:MAG: hypothetical protein CDV28_101161 [Candidatus Electronema aureum]|uniref:Uncharacterized protein n=1 Tax=Candidatus Electronema aureum TaxID=2005002 RepID=A0A521G5G8_9BACT|nr:MAG: hypothetical protein CDV28_101161 [Candidatus Electronema aureum]
MDKKIKIAEDYQKFLRISFDAYLTELKRGDLEPSEGYLPYDFEEAIDARHWQFDDIHLDVNRRSIINDMVKSELRELTNDLNQWHESLRNWYAWNKVLQFFSTDEAKAWELRRAFLETLIFYCLFQPSSSRDRLTFVVTNTMHQVRLMVEKGYQDYLKGDPKTPDEIKKPNHMSRQKKENRLSTLISIWPEGTEFMELLRAIDNEAYKKETSNYRNLHSHIIGPRLGLGHVRIVVRSVEERSTPTKQPDGTYIETPNGNVGPIYSFGIGIPPLDLEKARIANLEQYRRARRCYASYRKLFAVGLEAMPPVR